MILVDTEPEFRDLVCQHALELPPQQRVIANYMLDHLRSIPFLSVPQLAQRIGVSEATVVRFAQRLGYSGFSDLKMDLVDLLKERLGEERLPEQPDEERDLISVVADLEISNIQRTVEAIDRESFSAVADTLFRADHCYFYGMGVSAYLTELACYTLTQVGLRCTALTTRFSSPLEQLVSVRKGDALLVFSLPPYSTPTLDMLMEAKRRGADTIAICDRITAPAAVHAARALPARTDNMMFSNALASVLVLFNALATEITTRHRGEVVDALSYINRVLEEEKTLLPTDR